jgi:uncharacterized protein YndB with AHSA1/START domain
MPAIVEYPDLVYQLLEQYGDLFANEPERRHFAEYLTGLYVAERKNVSGINREFAVTTDQSCLNRWLTQVEWDVTRLNERRLELLQRDSSTRYTPHGTIPLDNTLIDHDGKLIEDVGWFWDHADKRHLIAHDYLIINYVCSSGKHYPLEFRRFRKRETCDAEGTAFANHTDLACELIDWVVAHDIPGVFTFDSYFTHAELLNHIHDKKRVYVGDLKLNRKIEVGGQELKLSAWGASLPKEARHRITINGKTQYWFSKSVQIPKVKHPVRLVLLWRDEEATEPHKVLVTNRTFWEITRILKAYRHRWTGTETFHRDGKQHLGMGECQLRNGQGQTRHMYLVFLAYSAVMTEMRQARPQEWAREMLTTVGQACRAMSREVLGKTIAWVVARTEEGWSLPKIKAHLALS